jgi:hypothetical protein
VFTVEEILIILNINKPPLLHLVGILLRLLFKYARSPKYKLSRLYLIPLYLAVSA